jgi:CMP-N,N'-diacetyllegionaminic acid synthase
MNEKLTTLLQQGKYKEIESKLANRKRNSQERVLYAVSLSNQGKSDAAEKEYLALLIAEPKNFDALNNLGNVYLKREDNKAALKYFKQAADAGHSEATHLGRAFVNMSVAARELGDQLTEMNALENAVKVAPQMSLALRALAVRYLTEKRCEEAIGLLLRAVSAEPRDVEAWANLSAGYTRIKKYEKGVEAAEEALKIRPDYAIAKANLGIALNSLERYAESKSWLLQAHEANLQYYNVYQALAQVSLNLEAEYEEARIWCEKGLQLAPKEKSLLRTMGDIIARQDRRASLSWFEKALEIDPEDVLSHWNASLNYLAIGEFNRGWEKYEWGFKQEKQGRGVELQFSCPRWRGESLKGKSLVIWGEQGVGDIVMFAHAIKEIAVQAKVACLLIPKRLLSIFERSIPEIISVPYEAYEVITKENKSFDYHCPIASTLQWTRNRREDFIDKVPYLKPDTDKVEAIKKRYQKLAGNRPIIGIAWKAGLYLLAKKKKTIDLEMLLPVVKNKDAYYVSLQYGDVDGELNRFATDYGVNIYYDKSVDGIADIDTWFAQICACDMVVSVATAGVHFAGAAGHRAKVLVPRGGNFNWQEADTKSLWYPQVEIYRQTKRGNWEDPVAKLAADVEVFVTAYNSSIKLSQSTLKEVLPELVDLKVRLKKPKVICVIPARGGSKGLLRKNIRTVGGHPLIAWPIAAARACPLIDRVILATDDEEMAETGRAYGAETPFLRTADVSGDLTTTEETLRYSLLESERIFGETFDIAVFLTGTDFFRLPGWVDQVVAALIEDPLLESAFVANRTHKNFWEKHDGNDGSEWSRLRDWMSVYSNRQVRKPIYREDTGLACASRAQLWRDGRRIGDRVKIIEADLTQSSLDIHDEFDLFLVEQALTWLARHRPDQLPPLPAPVAARDNV